MPASFRALLLVGSLVSIFGFGGLACSSSGNGSDGAAPAAPADMMPATPDHVDVPTCPVGQMTRAGSNACVQVGPTAVPDGFISSTPLWGFHAKANTGVCPPIWRAAIGTVECVHVDDCLAAFPPANAAAVVTADNPGALQLAVDSAAPGATIAVDAGTYAGIVVDRDINLVGRCASTVTFTATADVPGIGVDGPYKVSIKSLSFEGTGFGIWAGAKASVTLEKAIFGGGGALAWVTSGANLDVQNVLVNGTAAPGSRQDGLVVARGGHATIVDSELRAAHVALDVFGIGSTVSASRLFVTEASQENSALVVAAEGATVDVDHSRIVADQKFVGGSNDTDSRDPNGSAPATLRIATSELVRSSPTDPSGFDVTGKSSLTLIETTLAYRARIGISAEDTANVSLVHSVIRPVAADDWKTGFVGAGMIVNDGVHVSLDGSVIAGAAQSAIAASKDCRIDLSDSLIRDTWEFERTDFGTRLKTGQAISLSGNAQLVMTNSALENNAGVSLWMGPDGSSVQLDRSTIVSTQDPATSNATVGLYAMTGTLQMSDSLVHGIPDTAMALGKVTGLVSGSVLSKSNIGFRVMKDGQLAQAADDTTQPTAGQVLSRKNVLVDVATPQGDGAIALGDCRCSPGR